MNEEILARVDALAAALGVAASQIWAITVKQAFISGLAMVSMLVLGIVSVVISIAAVRNANASEKDDDAWGIVAILAGAIGVALLFFSLIELKYTLAAFLNPEYWALDDIVSKLSRIRR